MNYWVHTAGRYRAMSILGTVHAAFFNHHQFDAMTYIPDEIVLAKMMTTLNLEFEKALHYHEEEYESDNDYGLPAQVMRPMHIYSVSTTGAPSTWLTTRKHNTPSLPSCPHNPGMTYPPMKESADTSHLMRHTTYARSGL